MVTRVLLTVLLALYALQECARADSSCPTDRPLHDEAQLHNDLLCAYHTDFRPVKDHRNTVNVKVRLALKYINFDYLEETINIHSWVALSWKDEFLSWNPSNYGNITETQLESHEIWTPTMSLFNADASLYASDTFFTSCLARSTGTVVCVPHLVHSGICRTALRRWPYDVQNCTLLFGSWMLTGEQVNFTFFETRQVITDDYQNGPGWTLVKVYNERLPGKYDTKSNTSYPMLKYTFELKREAAGPAAIVIVPTFVIVVLTLTSLLLDIKNNIRLLLACFSLFGHFTYLSEIGYDIPKHSYDTPIILLFVRDSMIVTLVVILVTLLLMSLRRRAAPAPAWVVAVTRLAESGPARYAVFTEFDPSGEVSDRKTLADEGIANDPEDRSRIATEWIQVANLLNSCVFIISVLVYFILIVAYIPYD